MSDKKIFKVPFSLVTVKKDGLMDILKVKMMFEKLKPKKDTKVACISIEMQPTLELEYGTFARIVGITDDEVAIVLADDFNKGNFSEKFQKKIPYVVFLQNIKEIH